MHRSAARSGLLTAIFSITIASLCVFNAALAAKKTEFPDTDTFGLPRVKEAKVAALYLDPEADFARFKRFAIANVEVSFRKNWMRDQNRNRTSPGSRITQEDADRIKAAVAELFQEVFREELQNAGYAVVDGPIAKDDADDLLVLVPAIINLDVTSPDKKTAGRSYSFTASAGSMTLYMEFHEAASGALLGRALDAKAGPEMGSMTITNSVTNRAEASRMLRGWAKQLVNALDRANGKT